MKELKTKFYLPWLCSGYFNEILFDCEVEANMQKSRMVLEDCGPHDLGFVGDTFTWRNNHYFASGFTKERLDHAITNNAWRCTFLLVRTCVRSRTGGWSLFGDE
jgi:hypothetical protein